MGKRVIETVFDDLDESTEDVSTVPFSYDGSDYEIDLGKANQEALAKALQPYLGAARKTGGRRTRRSSSTPAAPAATSDTAAIRAWAAEQGITVSSRGRINAEVRKQYEAAQK